MKSKIALTLMLFIPTLILAQSGIMINENTIAKTKFVNNSKAMVQVLDSMVYFTYGGSAWEPVNKSCVQSRHWGTLGLPNEWHTYRYDDISSEWKLRYYEHYTYLNDTAEDVDTYLAKPFNEYTQQWEDDSMVFYNYVGYYSNQLNEYLLEGRYTYKNYDFNTNNITAGFNYDIVLKDDTLYDYYTVKEYNTASGLWVNSTKGQYFYDANNYVQKGISQVWDAVENSYINNTQMYYDFQNTDMMLKVFQSWNGSEWENDDKYTYEYNASHERIKQYNYDWDAVNSVWEYSVLTQHTYTGGLITETLLQNYNSVSSSWENNQRSVFTYDVNGNVLTERMEDWTGSAWQNDTRYTYTYNSNDQLTMELYETWNSGTTSWNNISKQSYTYDATFNTTNFLSQIWNGATLSWENEYKDDYTYDVNNNNTIMIHSNWNTVTSSWDFDYKYENFYSEFNATTINEIGEGAFTTFPNPSTDFISIDTRQNEYERILISDATGRIVLDQPMAETSRLINLRQFGTGLYTISLVKITGEINSGKVIVQ